MIQTATQAKTFGDWAYLALEKHFNKMLKHEKGVLKDQDPEELHQMRVGSRRLRSAMAGFAPALFLPKTLQDKTVGKIARTLGVLRDIDVLSDTLENKYRQNLPKTEQKLLDKALKKLSENREDALAKVKNLLEEGIYVEFSENFSQWLAQPTYQELATLPIGLILADLLLPQLSKFFLHPAWLLNVNFDANNIVTPLPIFPQIVDGDKHQITEKEYISKLLAQQGETLHELRKEAKRTRYLMELFTHFYGEDYGKYLQDVEEIQEVLGNIQDAQVLEEFLLEVVGVNLKKSAPTLQEQLSQTCHDSFLQWRSLQTKFLQAKYRQGFKLTCCQS